MLIPLHVPLHVKVTSHNITNNFYFLCKWSIVFQTIDFFIHTILKKMGNISKRLCLLDHFIMGVILFGKTEQVLRQSLRNVSMIKLNKIMAVSVPLVNL